MERAAFTDAFNFERRVGLSAGYENGPLIANVGVFTDNVHDLDDENNSIGGDARLVFAPKMGETQLHFGGSAHFRDNKDLAERGDTIRYRQRPMVHSPDTRFLATPALDRKSVGSGKSVSVRVALGGPRILNNKNYHTANTRL